MKATPDAVSIWIWNCAHQVHVVMLNLPVFDHFDGYRDSSGDQPNVGIVGGYTRIMSQSNVALSIQRMVIRHGVSVAR